MRTIAREHWKRSIDPYGSGPQMSITRSDVHLPASPFYDPPPSKGAKRIEMPQYCVNKTAQLNGDHEVHAQGCIFWPHPVNTLSLDWHEDCRSAMQTARAFYRQVNGCRYCSPACNTGPRASNDDIGPISYRGASKEDAGPEFISAHSLRLREIKQRLGC